jgi:hypothetical protein
MSQAYGGATMKPSNGISRSPVVRCPRPFLSRQQSQASVDTATQGDVTELALAAVSEAIHVPQAYSCPAKIRMQCALSLWLQPCSWRAHEVIAVGQLLLTVALGDAQI